MKILDTIINKHFASRGTEPFFGKCLCSKCDTGLAGDRHEAVEMGWDTASKTVVILDSDAVLCTDCLMDEA